jgi:proline iminopeptidase
MRTGSQYAIIRRGQAAQEEQAMQHADQGRHVWALVLIVVFLVVSPQPGNSQVVNVMPVGAQAGSDTGTIVAGKFRLRYRIEGAGPPAIVIGSAVYYPRVFSQNLRKHLRLVFLDHRGFAPSPGPVDTEEFALDVIVDDIERARKELGLGRVAVIGHSGHALMALEYAKKYPASVSHVIMIDMAPDLSAASAVAVERHWQESVSPERKAVMEENLRRLPNEKLALLPPGERIVRSYIRDGPRYWYDPRFDSSTLWEGVEVNADMINYVWGRVFRDIDIAKGLATFDRPVFLALGRYDFAAAPPSAWDPVRPKFRDLTVRIFERSGHTPPYEEPALFDAELLRWMKDRP